MIRMAGIIVFVVIHTFAMTVAAIISSLFGSYTRCTNGIIRLWAKGILWISGIKMEVEGLENIEPGKSYIYIANHQSNFDILATAYAIPGTVRFVAKKELFRIPLFAQSMRMAGMIPIDRGKSAEARRTLDMAIEKVRQGVSLILFPEGTRSLDGAIHDFKKGGFVLAINGRFDILPICICGSRHIMPKNSLKLNKGRIKVQFLTPVSTKDYTMDDRHVLVEMVRNRIVERFDPDYH